ncbi:uncharacterized protein LOC110976393 isoform X2 [Acanthaster planci]|uniref:Uncharacterized protein LOC110976393 isoform X2 n=1 Tax=Acanthaster planci TaxID=133434 RepID=A0A8B7XZ57_ACAPL|nr:uncharacterized protein LOC110976393 isoform X2 [Acanthaster planci]
MLLSKLKYLKEEEKALKDIEMMIKEQINRLKQEELYLNSLLRNSSEKGNPAFSLSLSQPKKDLLDVDNAVNKVPLDDLQSASHRQLHANDLEDAEEDDEEEEMDSGDDRGSQEENKINKDLMALMRQMQGEEYYEDDS